MNGISNFAQGAHLYRAVNRNPADNPSYASGILRAENIGNYLRETNNYSFQWLFLNTTNPDVYSNLVTTLPISLVFRNMINLARPIYTDFTETTRNKDFLKVSAMFYRELFWVGRIYVSYNLFDMVDITFDGKEPMEFKHLKKRGGFELFIKASGKELDDDITFIHIETGIGVKIKDWEDYMVKAEWSADALDNFSNWFEYSIYYLTSLRKIEAFSNLLIKRIRIEGSGRDVDNVVDEVKNQVTTTESYLFVDAKNKADLLAVEYAIGQDLEALHYTTFNTLDRRAYELGRVSNTNPKGERLTSGENYKDISSIANRQKCTLERLISFGNEVEDKFGIKLEFAVSGIPEKQMVPEESAKAPNPNTDGSTESTAEAVR